MSCSNSSVVVVLQTKPDKKITSITEKFMELHICNEINEYTLIKYLHIVKLTSKVFVAQKNNSILGSMSKKERRQYVSFKYQYYYPVLLKVSTALVI